MKNFNMTYPEIIALCARLRGELRAIKRQAMREIPVRLPER